jgi:formylglycine-generating enzyme required for sulfatase activity
LWPKVAGVGAAVLLSVSLLGYALSGGGAARPPADGGGSAVDAPPTALKSKDYTETLPNGVKLEMAAIPAGKFTMGSTDAQIAEAIKTCKQQCSGCNCDYYNNEKPQREVSVPAMYMGKYEVTQEQWQAVMNNNPSRFQNCPKCPVENVSWEDVKEFIKKLNSLQNKYVYRLPSEAEWEYNARAGTKTAFAFGDSLSSSQANFDGNYPYGGAAKGEYRRKTIPVGSFQPNAFGLYDMHGNVWEWCEDIYQDNYNSLPTDGSPNMSRGDSSFRLLRGGSWFNDGYVLRSARRVRVGPSVRLVNYGARLAASAK